MLDLQRRFRNSDNMLVETFRSELPSLCTVHLSGKQTCAVKRHHGGGSIRLKFATENHSIALVERAANNRAGGEDGYSLSHTRLRPPQRNQRLTNNNDDEEKKEERNIYRSSSRCLAHTMLFYEGIMGCVEVFAMEGGRRTENANNTMTDCDNEVATSSIYGAGNDGGGAIATTSHHRRQTSVDTTVTTSNQSSAINVENEVAANVTTVENMKYWLVVKDCTTNDVLSTIPLDFCPMLVHLAEIDISTIDNGDEEESNDDEGEINDVSDGSSFSPKAIGIFISSIDDNTPRLYIATKEALRVRMRRDDGEQSNGSGCFVLVSLNDLINAQNDDNDSASEQPLTFSTPIMAMDTIMTDFFPDKCSKKINYLAISCYDGIVRILTYRLIWNNKRRDNSDSVVDLPRLCPLRCSSFYVDGPVASLHFGITTVASDIPLIRQSHSLFLVAGSLCGFACLFYESSRPSSNPNKVGSVDRYFDGPVTVVDGLYDAREGGEDCVTSVHVVCHLDEGDRMIAVGTQGGRVLLFAWCEDEKRRFAVIGDEIITARHEKDESTHRLDQTKEQITVLQNEKDEMGMKASNLNTIISYLQGKIDRSLNSSTTDNRELVEEEEIQHDKIDCAFNITQSLSNYELEMKAVESELASLQQSMYGHACILEELSSIVIDLVRQIDEKNNDIARRGLQLPQMARKLHRYTILCEKYIPYPIHGIASYTHQEEGSVKRDILVSTRRSFHVFRHHNLFMKDDTNI